MQKYDEDEFIRIWNESATAHEVAERTGMTSDTVWAWGRRLGLGNLERISAEEFVTIWNASSDLEDAAKRLSRKKEGAKVRASTLRSEGRTLKSFKKSLTLPYMAGRLETANIELRDRGTFKAPRVRLGISDEVVKAAIIAKFGGHPARCSITWESQEGILALLISVAPYMIERKAQAQELIDWIEGRQK